MIRSSFFAFIAATTLSAAPAGAPTTAVAPRADDPVSRVEACQRRFAALCQVIHRCAAWAADTGGANCEAIDPGCDELAGLSPYPAGAVTRCVSELNELACPDSLDPNDVKSMDLEAGAAACRPLVAADARLDSQQLAAR